MQTLIVWGVIYALGVFTGLSAAKIVSWYNAKKAELKSRL